MHNVTQTIITGISHSLRARHGETFYKTSKASGLRPETIHKIEEGAAKGVLTGSSLSTGQYIDSFCSRFPSEAYRLFYNLSIAVAQQQIPNL